MAGGGAGAIAGDSFSDNSDSFDTRGVTSFNEYTVAAGATLDYGDNGNLMNDEKNLHYHWDAFNRLHRVTDADDATTATYTYDSDGRRLMKDLPGTANDVSFAYDGWQIILEYAGAAGQPLRQYTYGAFINEPLFMDVADGNGEFLDEGDSSPLERYSYLQTPIYNVAALVDYDTQELVERYDYDPYGKYTLIVGDTRTESGQSTVGNSMTFTGHWFDRETGMYWMRKRYYNNGYGFISRDPGRERHAGYILAPYLYCNNNSIKYIDIFGLAFIDPAPSTLKMIDIANDFMNLIGGPSNTYVVHWPHSLIERIFKYYKLDWIPQHYEKDMETYCDTCPYGFHIDHVNYLIRDPASDFWRDFGAFWGWVPSLEGLPYNDIPIYWLGSINVKIDSLINCKKKEKKIDVVITNTVSTKSATRNPYSDSSLINGNIFPPQSQIFCIRGKINSIQGESHDYYISYHFGYLFWNACSD